MIQTGKRKLLFVGFDSTSYPGLRGPTNLFGHPTDQLLSQLSSALSEWDSESAEPIKKIAFGHFPLSFSAASPSGTTLEDVFIEHGLSAYLCGHLHTRFGKNLKRHHQSGHRQSYFNNLIQFDANRPSNLKGCSNQVESEQQFWEMEMGDWRKSRSMRILAIDRGHISFTDIDFKLGANKPIILPTFPLDSRFTETSYHMHKCKSMNPLFYETIRALVFSASPVMSVVAGIYDSRSGNLVLVWESSLEKVESTSSRGDLYSAPWNYVVFEDTSPERYWLQIEATDSIGRSTLSELRPFSVNGLPAKLSWRWKEFVVMGCQWSALYYPIFWSLYFVFFLIVLAPKVLLSFSVKRYTFKHYSSRKGIKNFLAWTFTELYNVPFAWGCLVCYLFYLILAPWFFGRVFTDDTIWGYMTYRGWVLGPNELGKLDFLGFPDVMVVVIPHLVLVILPASLAIMAFAAERGLRRDYLLSITGKKEDDNQSESHAMNSRLKFLLLKRWIRKVLLVITLAIWWKHFKNCRALVKAYEMNPFIHFPIYSLTIPLLMAYTVYITGRT
ncbi:OLC1v1025685C2 [Oldenlandia corymbosa var. corymbosa]|uniref:OLC1v1025685C2 n=1 Tax=Oldenlandia corymbosa var. corymbosa TaxID=529605 RepID=A0AAV1C7G0_OLDCO|nr:OLC1v1025685C2 [Oldenlandia corymbosa var. corymbosa]